jgi:ATP-binding cassette subfamily F protein 3
MRARVALLEVADLEFGSSNDPLFSKVTFRLNTGERAALVAPNGAGKSTLFRILAGEVAQDKGSVLVDKRASVGYYRQSHEMRAEGSVLDALLSGFGEIVALRRELGEAQRAAASGARADLERLAEASDRYHLADADRLEHRVQAIATRLGFRPSDLDRPVATLSGGERGRLALGVVLATEPDLLLLDEPTNHLDLDSIRWLEGHLTAYRGGVLIVSHDRAFLDAVCPFTMELGRTTFRTYPVAYSEYYEQRAEDLEREREKAEEQAAFIAKTEDFIRKNLAGQKTKQAQSRRKQLEKLERDKGPEDVWARAGRVRFRFAEAPRSGDIVLEATGLGAVRGDNELFAGVDLLVRRGDRVGVVGPNGSGKSTLMKLLAGKGDAHDRGHVRRGTNLYEGYFDQHLGSLKTDRSGVEEIRSVRGDFNLDGARQYLARFRFYGDDPLRKVASLSGGERTRLSLAKLLLEPRNLLFLDEPTNHLDIPAAEILEEALIGFEGTVILVSHDRRFLENVTTRTVAFTEHGVDVYEGGFREYCDALARIAAHATEQRESEKRHSARREESERRDSAKGGAAAALDAGKDSHRLQKARARELERKQKRLAELETLIASGESEVSQYRAELKGVASGQSWESLHALAQKEQTLTRKLAELTGEWVKLSEDLEGS